MWAKDRLIPLKTNVWLDLSARRNQGAQHVLRMPAIPAADLDNVKCSRGKERRFLDETVTTGPDPNVFGIGTPLTELFDRIAQAYGLTND